MKKTLWDPRKMIDPRGGEQFQTGPVVLIVEDDPLQRLLAVELVHEAGCCAIEACDADEAIALLESRLDIRLLFTDIDMPGSIDGLKLSHAVHRRWPPIKIILVSGQSKPREDQIPVASAFLCKPYGTAAMVSQLRQMVDLAA